MNFKNVSCVSGLAGLVLVLGVPKAQALQWNFSYTSPADDITASGILITDGTDYDQDQYTITGIEGQRNEETITSLLQPGTFLNNDNLFFPNAAAQLSDDGFAYSTPSDSYNVYQEVAGVAAEASTNPFISNEVAFSVTPATAVPFDFSPSQGIVLGLPLFISLRMLKKRMASKKSKSTVDFLIS